jgi:putative spermidine/putrescine transport system substrate-binding protein
MNAFSRRRFLSMTATSIALIESGRLTPAWAEEKFTIASTGGSWGEGVRESFVVGPKFVETSSTPVEYSHQLESVAAAKIIAQRGNPPYTVSGHGEAEAILMADAGAIDPYDLNIVTNYKDIYDTAKLPPRAGMNAWWASFQMLIWGLAYNTKEASKPASFQDLFNDKYKNKIGIPAYSWYGMYWLHAFNKTLGGNEDNISPGMEAIARLVKKNGALIVENVDQGMKAFTREEIVMAPFWNGRTFALQENGVPLEMAYPPGTIQVGNGALILKGTRFQELAHRYVNNTLNGEFQLGMTSRFKYPPTNKTTKLPPKFAGYAVPEASLANMVALDWTKINQHRDKYLDRWNKEVLS